MSKKLKTLRVACAGFTASDGREIKAQWLEDIAATYSKETYGARCWIEHMRNWSSSGPFPAIGDVESVYTQKDVVNGEETLCLYATVKPLPELVEMNKAGQKIYTSIEVEPDFSKTGKAYLMGLAFTDSPASLGTEALQFNRHVAKHKSNIFSTALETEMSDSWALATAFAEGNALAKPLLDRINELETQVATFTAASNNSTAPVTEPTATSANTAIAVAKMMKQFSDTNSEVTKKLDEFSTALQQTNEKLSALEAFKQQIEETETNTVAPHDGNHNNQQLADC